MARISWHSMPLLLTLVLLVLPLARGASEDEWQTDAHSTFYTGTSDVSGGYNGNCGYGDLSKSLAGLPPYGPLFFAGSPLLYRGGAGCGSCYEIRCANHGACNGRSVVVTMTDFCPTEGNLPWCAPDKVHFDLSGYAMAQIVKDVSVGTTPLEYRRVDCPREGPAVVGVVGNPYWMEISVMNLAKAGSYDSMRVKDDGGVWKDLKRDWGANFVANEELRGNISVQIADSATGNVLTLEECIPGSWTTGSAFACNGNYGGNSGEETIGPQTPATSTEPPPAPVSPPPSTAEPTHPDAPDIYAYECSCELKSPSR